MSPSPPTIVLGALFLAYPLLVYCGLTFFEPHIAALVLVLLAIGRFALAKPATTSKGLAPHLSLAFAAALVIGIFTLITNSSDYLRLYPVCINILMFVLFLNSLLRPPSIVERIARISEPDLSAAGITYTRKVTKAWCCFFVFNGTLSLFTGLSTSLEVWALYNGVISYLLMALLFGGEYMFRARCRRREIF